MKKNYIAPEVQVVIVEVSQLICESLGVNDDTTSSQWSRDDGGCGWDEGDE